MPSVTIEIMLVIIPSTTVCSTEAATIASLQYHRPTQFMAVMIAVADRIAEQRLKSDHK
jgi:hypothetical protein